MSPPRQPRAISPAHHRQMGGLPRHQSPPGPARQAPVVDSRSADTGFVTPPKPKCSGGGGGGAVDSERRTDVDAPRGVEEEVVSIGDASSHHLTSSVKNLMRRRSLALAQTESSSFSAAHDAVDARDTLRLAAIAAATKAVSRKDLQAIATVEKAARDRKVAQFLTTFDAAQFRPERNSTMQNAYGSAFKGGRSPAVKSPSKLRKM